MNDSPAKRNIKLVIAYNGAAYHGWQRQAKGIDTIQLRIEQVASRVMGHPVIIHGAGRTDAGVHAEGQVANFHTDNLAIPLRGMGRAYVELGLVDSARIAFEQAIALDSLYSPAYFNLALLLEDEGHREEALRNAQKALSLDSRNLDYSYS